MQKIAIVTNFLEFHPGYSLTGIVKDQCLMLREYGHEVVVFVSENFNDHDPNRKFFDDNDVFISPTIPQPDLIDYKSKEDLTDEHKTAVREISDTLESQLNTFDFVFTHDFVFTGWNLPYALGLMRAGRKMRERGDKVKFCHWIHSVPNQGFDWWHLREYGPGHKLVYPNKTDRLRVAAAYGCKVSDVRSIPHIKDLRTFFDFDDRTRLIIRDKPEIMQADIVQVYPIGSDRLHAKKLKEVILLFSNFKRMGFTICLCVANSWATGRAPMQDIEYYERVARRNGLTKDEFFFTSRLYKNKYETGLPIEIVRELLLCSNLLIYPTNEESFGLIGVEAALGGGCMVVANKSLEMMLEVHGFATLFVEFGSHEKKVNLTVSQKEYFQHVANLIIGRMRENETLSLKTYHRQSKNLDYIYKKYYAPMFGESITWG